MNKLLTQFFILIPYLPIFWKEHFLPEKIYEVYPWVALFHISFLCLYFSFYGIKKVEDNLINKNPETLSKFGKNYRTTIMSAGILSFAVALTLSWGDNMKLSLITGFLFFIYSLIFLKQKRSKRSHFEMQFFSGSNFGDNIKNILILLSVFVILLMFIFIVFGFLK
ncbi:hypothetical protein H6775_03450 [Candidatus Nomurabacteria bacterium]|nr:hypothetical protein [Candidatus Nomurabacteria bacterium]